MLSLLRLGCIRPSVKDPGLDYQAWNCSGIGSAGDSLSAGRKISDIVLVQQGVTARNFGNAVSGPKAAAISTPGHFACGNLNFLTRRPSLGTYFALTKAQVVVCPKDLLLPVLTTDPELFAYTIRLLESCTLSDRVGFALMPSPPLIFA